LKSSKCYLKCTIKTEIERLKKEITELRRNRQSLALTGAWLNPNANRLRVNKKGAIEKGGDSLKETKDTKFLAIEEIDSETIIRRFKQRKDLEDWLNDGSKDFEKYELYEVKSLTVKVEVTEEGTK